MASSSSSSCSAFLQIRPFYHSHSRIPDHLHCRRKYPKCHPKRQFFGEQVVKHLGFRQNSPNFPQMLPQMFVHRHSSESLVNMRLKLTNLASCLSHKPSQSALLAGDIAAEPSAAFARFVCGDFDHWQNPHELHRRRRHQPTLLRQHSIIPTTHWCVCLLRCVHDLFLLMSVS